MKTRILFAIAALAVTANSLAQEAAAPERQNAGPQFDIFGLIDEVAADIDREFIVDPRARGISAHATADEIDYDTLLGILRINGFVAIDNGQSIRVVPEQNMRAEPIRILQEDDSGVSDHEVITRIITVEGMDAPQLVPILRPMMLQAGQLAAVTGTNQLILVDRYDNVRRMTAIIEEITDGLN